MLRVIFYVTGVFMSSQYAGVSLQAETTQRNVEAGSPGTFWVQKWLDSQTLKNKKRGWVSAFPKNIPSNVRIVWWNCDKRLHPGWSWCGKTSASSLARVSLSLNNWAPSAQSEQWLSWNSFLVLFVFVHKVKPDISASDCVLCSWSYYKRFHT